MLRKENSAADTLESTDLCIYHPSPLSRLCIDISAKTVIIADKSVLYRRQPSPEPCRLFLLCETHVTQAIS